MDDGTFESVWNIDTDPREVIGTGPFRLASSSYSPEESLVGEMGLLAQGRRGQCPAVPGIGYHIVPDLNTELHVQGG